MRQLMTSLPPWNQEHVLQEHMQAFNHEAADDITVTLEPGKCIIGTQGFHHEAADDITVTLEAGTCIIGTQAFHHEAANDIPVTLEAGTCIIGTQGFHHEAADDITVTLEAGTCITKFNLFRLREPIQKHLIFILLQVSFTQEHPRQLSKI